MAKKKQSNPTIYRFLQKAVTGSDSEIPGKQFKVGDKTPALSHWSEPLIGALIVRGVIEEVIADVSAQDDNNNEKGN